MQPTNLPQPPTAAAVAAQVPLPQAIAQIQPAVPIAAPAPAPAAQTSPVAPVSVILVDPTGTEHLISVAAAKLTLTRTAEVMQGAVELKSRVHGNPNITSLLAVANMVAPYTLTLRYCAPNGVILRNDSISVLATSRSVYRGPEIEETDSGWEFFETLTIHA